MIDIGNIILPIAFFVIIIGLHLFYGFISDNDLEMKINDYFKKEKVTEINKLSTSEKLRNGIPANIYFRILSKGFSLFYRFESNYYRAISFENGDDKYVQIIIRRKEIMELNEFKG